MNPNNTDKGLGSTPEKQATLSSVAMEKHKQSTKEVSQAAAPTSATSLEDANRAKGQTSPKALTATTIFIGIEPQAPNTNPSFEQGATSSSESSEYEDDLPLPTFPHGPGDASLIRGIGPPARIPQAMQKKEKEFSTPTLEQKGVSKFPNVQRKGDPKTVTSANTKTLPGINPIAKATGPDTTGKFQFALDTSISQGVKTEIVPGINPIAKATVPDTISKFQFTLNTPIPQKSVQSSAAEPFLFTQEAKQQLKEAQAGPAKRRLFKPFRMEDDDDDAPKFPPLIFNLPESFAFAPQDKKPAEGSKVLPEKASLSKAFPVPRGANTGINRIAKATVPETTGKPQFALDTHTPRGVNTEIVPGINPIAKATVPDTTGKFQFALNTPGPQGVNTRVLPGIGLVAKATVPDSTDRLQFTLNTPIPQCVNTETQPTNAPKQPVQEPESTPVKSQVGKPSVLTAEMQKEIYNLKNEIKQQKAKEAELKGSMGKEIQELRLKLRKSEEGVEVRALQNNEESKGIYRDVSSLRARNDQQVRELEDLRAKLVKETEAKQEAASRANRLQKTINEQADALREAGVEKAELLTTVDNQTAELAKYKRQQTGLQAEADIGLVKEAMKGERARLGEEDKRREDRVQGALGNLREGEEGRRQRLMNELETKDAELYEANRQVRELGRKLLASNQATAAALAAVSASKSSQSSLSSPSPTSISTPPSSSTPSTAMPWLQLSLSPRRFLILLFIFLLSFAIPIFHFNSLSQQAAEERKMRQTEVVRPRDQRIIQEARTLAMWEQNDPVMTEEEGWRRTLEAARRNNEGF